MISETSQIERELARKDAESDEAAREEADRAWARMQRGKDCYAFAAIHIAEAINEADVPTMHEVQRALEENDLCEVGALVRSICRDYWERQAKAPRVLRSVR